MEMPTTQKSPSINDEWRNEVSHLIKAQIQEFTWMQVEMEMPTTLQSPLGNDE